MNEKELIENKLEQIRDSFSDEGRLYEYLFQTMDNFYYRYIETTSDKGLKTKELSEKVFGAVSFEGSMIDALKIQNPVAKKGIIDLAKFTPKELGPKVRYTLSADVKRLTPNSGSVEFSAEINWGFPDYNDNSKHQKKSLTFKYDDVAQFRKELALTLEDVSEIFL